MYYIYILRCDDNSLYTGITTDIKKRFEEHFFKKANCAKYTKSRNVIALEALWSAKNRSDASKLEYSIKRLSKAEKEELVKAPQKVNIVFPNIADISVCDAKNSV